MHLLDTDTLTHLHAGHPRVVNHLRDVDDPVVGTTVITKGELLRGRIEFLLKAPKGADLLRAQQWLTRTENLLAQILVVPFDENAAREFDRLRANQAYRKIGRADLLIASIVLANQAILVTRNVRHFRQIHAVQIVNWVD
ncbi:MAG: twitching motility protein PilT [Cyanobacteria bacterium 13_1_40CM_2_61_4]|nr:MAG: twitching motility protein PilT [Cyanobacteria bacterium 13_1_40CM_2_61_4]